MYSEFDFIFCPFLISVGFRPKKPRNRSVTALGTNINIVSREAGGRWVQGQGGGATGIIVIVTQPLLPRCCVPRYSETCFHPPVSEALQCSKYSSTLRLSVIFIRIVIVGMLGVAGSGPARQYLDSS